MKPIPTPAKNPRGTRVVTTPIAPNNELMRSPPKLAAKKACLTFDPILKNKTHAKAIEITNPKFTNPELATSLIYMNNEANPVTLVGYGYIGII